VSRRIVYRPEAADEIAAATEWYARRGPSLAADFLYAFDSAIESIRDDPLRYPEVDPGKRRVLLRRFPFTIVYSPSAEEVVVLACTHWRRDAASWERR
jgi:toxin ParE1/3/4